MNKSLKKKILIVAAIVSLAIVFVPIYFFVLADTNDDNKFRVSSKKIIDIIDGTASFDADDSVGNDSSSTNNRVRTFDSIKYTVEYILTEKVAQSTSSNVEGRNLLVEVLIPTVYETTLRYGDSVSVYMDERSNDIVTIDGSNYYYGSFSVPVHSLDTPSTFEFVLDKVNSNDIANSNSIKPLIFIKESTDEDSTSVRNASSMPGDITCEKSINTTDPNTGEVSTSTSNNCDVTITGREDYFVNMYSGSKKTDTKIIPVGILVGLRNQGEKGIKGLIIPKNITFNITNSDSNKLSFNEDAYYSYRTYQSTADYRIDINENNIEMPELNNGEISGSINGNTLSVTISNIKDYLYSAYTENSNVEFYSFSSNYILTTIADRTGYGDIIVNLSANKNNSSNNPSGIQIVDSYAYVLGNYSSNIDVYESSLTSNESENALEYGKANINYGADFTLKTTFDYSSLSNSTGDGLTSLTNYIKIDNDAFKLVNNKNSNKGYNFVAGEVTSIPSIKVDTETAGDNTHEKVLFGFGEWNSNYFDIAPSAPSNCPSTMSGLTKEQLMNLYGGPCIVAKNTVKWAYSPVSENDIDGNPITSNKGPLIVKSTYVSYNTQYIEPASSGTLELYGTVVDNYTLAKTAHQIVTCATAYGKDSNDFRYLGNESNSGLSLLSEKNNFVKTNYDFNQRKVITNNSNICASNRCPVTGTTILVSGIKVTKPIIKAYKSTSIDGNPESNFYYYPIALKVNASAAKSDEELRYEAIYVDLYLPDYMIVDDNYGTAKNPTIENTTLANIRSRLNEEAPAENINYKVYHYVLTAENPGLSEDDITNLQRGILSNFTVYSDIDLITTPNASRPEIYTVVDFKAKKNIGNNNNVSSIEFSSITPEEDRYDSLDNVTLYNSSAIITKASATPNNIEKNGSYTFNMLAYNHSESVVAGGYVYPTADLYYVLPYTGDLASSETSSKIGSTKFTVNFTSESINSISNINDYKFYYATTGTPSNVISDEIKTTSDVSAIWHAWNNPTEPKANVLAIKVVKQSPFAVNTYFGSSNGLAVNVKTVDSTDGNTFYNSFHILASKPDNYTCDASETGEAGYDYCSEASQTKANYASSSSKTSIYERVISGFVFEDYDYNGIYTSDESKLKDIPVSLYKIDTIPENYDPIDPTTFVSETDTLVSATITGENGNYYFGGLSSGNYYVSYTINNNKYIVTDLGKTDESIPDSSNNNSSASLLPNTNNAITHIISFPTENSSGKLIVDNVNLGLAIKKEMAIKLNKYINEVTVNRNGKIDTYDYSNQAATQVSINVLNPKNTKVTVKYVFSIENTKYFPGYVGMIVDNMPDGMTFNPNLKENQYWVMYDNLLYYNGLSGKLLLPNERQYFTLVLDLDLKQGGTYRNVVSARDLTLMGDEIPVYDFSGLNSNTSNENIQGGE